MREPYRTLLGHFRHEVGHYYWDLLVRDGGKLDAFRALFGDERAATTAQALQRHYAAGRAAGLAASTTSAPTRRMHPWEDFAETWAHYLHIVDTLETAARLRPATCARAGATARRSTADDRLRPLRAQDFDRLIEAWLPLTFAVNSLNRSMGQPDLYPFVLSPPVVEKLGFVHGLVRGA